MKSNWRVIFTMSLVAVVFLSACGFRVTQGSGTITTESRPVSGISAVELAGFGELTIVQGDSESLTVETDDNLLPYIKTTVSDGTLTIGLDDDTWLPLLRPTKGIHYQLTVKELNRLEMNGAGTVGMAQLASDNMTLMQSGAGKIKIDQLTANNLDANLSGAGTVELAGKVTHQNVEMSGLGSYEAGDLDSESAKVSLSGAGTATVWVTESLDAEMAGVGSIRYFGSPTTQSEASGIGTLQSLGDK